jgi:hypothetical protein
MRCPSQHAHATMIFMTCAFFHLVSMLTVDMLLVMQLVIVQSIFAFVPVFLTAIPSVDTWGDPLHLPTRSFLQAALARALTMCEEEFE